MFQHKPFEDRYSHLLFAIDKQNPINVNISLFVSLFSLSPYRFFLSLPLFFTSFPFDQLLPWRLVPMSLFAIKRPTSQNKSALLLFGLIKEKETTYKLPY
jgi:hypothetical protein